MRLIKPNILSSVDGSLSRASVGNYWNSSKVLTSAAINEARFNYNPETGLFDGILVEPSSTNLVLNNSTLSTQSITVSNATEYTFSFYGTGTVVLSGAHTETLVGSGVYVRKVVTFSTTTTSLAITVTGSCTHGQLELGNRATSVITTTGSSATRSADVITGSGLIYTDLVDPNPLYSAATTYAIGAVVRYNNRLYESLQATNLNHQPDTSATWWLDIGVDNLHASFDNSVSTSSSALTTMTIVFKPGAIDSIALINMNAATAKITLTNPLVGTVYSRIAGLSGAEVFDWYQYFFYDPLDRRTQLIFTDVPKVNDGLVTIRLEGSLGELITIGQVLLGVINTIGDTQYGVTSGIIDYSIKDTDEFGNTSFVERAFSKRISANVFVNNPNLNRAQRLLQSVRATPCVWIASDSGVYEESLIVFGFYRSFSIDISYPSYALCNIEIEGLT